MLQSALFMADMASGGHLRDSDVPDIYSCAVCMEYLLDRNPRFLSCHHSFCQQCLQRLTNNAQLHCPTCRAVTAVPNNDVTKLAMNFQLVKIMEHLKAERQPNCLSPHCLFCSKDHASYKCKECNQFLCEGCKIKHNKMKTFKSHVILKLCQQHLEGISHICLQCVKALCIKCIVLDHEDHEYRVEEYNEGMEKLKSKLQKVKNKLEERTNMIQEHQQEITKQKINADEKKKELQLKRDALLKQIEEIDDELVLVTEKVETFISDDKMCNALIDKCVVTSKTINELLQSPDEQMLLGFLKQEPSIETIFSKTERFKPEFAFLLEEELEWLTKPLLITKFIKLGEFEIECPNSIKAIEQGVFVYSDLDTSRYIVFNYKGDVIRNFTGLKEYGKVKCVNVYNNNLYLAQEKRIMCVSNFNTTEEKNFYFMPKIKKLYRVAVANNNYLVCTDYGEGKVFGYNTDEDTTKLVLQGLGHPSYISVSQTSQGIRYILSLDPTSYSKACVKIYNEFWHLLTTITQIIVDPHDTAPCPGGFLLADQTNKTINLYSYTGDLVRTVLTQDDGLDEVMTLTVQPPFIWVAYLDSYVTRIKADGCIKCFRFLK